MAGTVAPGDLLTPPIMLKSWVTVAKQKQVLQKFDLDISISEGTQSVIVPSAILEEANPLWGDFVIARFMDTAPHVAKVHMILNKIWRFGEKDQKIDVHEVDPVTMRIRIPSELIRNKIVRRGMWNIAGVPMVVSHWSPVDDESKKKLIPLWVHLTGVPMSMYSWEGLSFISSAAGEPDRLHPETIACTDFEVAKVMVKADFSKQLPKRMNFTIGGEDKLVEFTYPRLPMKCTNCGKWGHSDLICLKKEEEGKQEKNDTKESQEVEHVEGNKEEEVVEAQKNKEEEANQKEQEEGEVDEIETGLLEDVIVDSGKNVNEVKNDEKWMRVSMEKASRSPKNIQDSSKDTIITPSRFEALSNFEEKEEEMVQQKGEDKEQTRREGTEIGIENDELFPKIGDVGRKILPRNSKTHHRVLSEASNQLKSDLGISTRGSRKNHN